MLNDAGLALIAEFEGFRASPYEDPAGHCTVGYGELLHLGNCTAEELARAPITEEQGYAYLRQKVQGYYDCVMDRCPGLNENQAAALTSLAYNIGCEGFRTSRVAVVADHGGDPCVELNQIIHGTNGVVYPGLVRRRQAECVLYHRPIAAIRPVSEEDFMPAVVWNTDLKTVQLVGFARPIIIGDAGEVATLEGKYGKQIALSDATIKQMTAGGG